MPKEQYPSIVFPILYDIFGVSHLLIFLDFKTPSKQGSVLVSETATSTAGRGASGADRSLEKWSGLPKFSAQIIAPKNCNISPSFIHISSSSPSYNQY